MGKVLLQRVSLVLKRKPMAVVGIAEADDAARIARRLIADVDREVFLVLLLDKKHRVNAVHAASVGDIDRCLLSPRQVFTAALLCGAQAVILAHNHPSGEPEPSVEDIRLTRRLVEAGELLGIEVLDHVIVGERNKMFSFYRQGIMPAPTRDRRGAA